MGRVLPEPRVGERREECGGGRSTHSPLVFRGGSPCHLLKACVKGAVFALEELLPAMLVPVMASDALDVARGEFTEFAVKNSLGLLLGTPGGPRKRHGADAAVVPRQRGGLVVVQLLLHIGRLRVGGVCGQTGKINRTPGRRAALTRENPDVTLDYFFFF